MAVTILNYPKPFEVSQFYLNVLNIVSFPLDLNKVICIINKISLYNILIATEEEYIEYRTVTNDTRDFININDGRTYYVESQNLYFIVYNSSKPSKRIRFTIAHELGHILLGHLENEITEINRGGISDELYQELENQADVFAGNFLVPPVLLNERLKMLNSPNTPYLVSETFKISEKAVYNRYKDFDVWKNRRVISPAEKNILQRCKNSVCYIVCNNCKAETCIVNPEIFNVNNPPFCMYCGNNNFSYLRSTVMKYEGVKMDSNNKAVICPICNNENIISEGDFCQICGTKLINECMGITNDYGEVYSCEKGKRLSGEARFCPYCGGETTFLKKGILKPVIEVENTALSEINVVANSDLPF
ncbi:MAG: ImmA/IrrE family metallo-endopeptidase [Oscillospiraceae bacterium]